MDVNTEKDQTTANATPGTNHRVVVLLFNERNHIYLRKIGGTFAVTAEKSHAPASTESARNILKAVTGLELIEPKLIFDLLPGDEAPGAAVFFALADEKRHEPTLQEEFVPFTIEEIRHGIAAAPDQYDSILKTAIDQIAPYAIRIPYLNLSGTDYIYRFRTDSQRNREIYRADARAQALYQSRLCSAIKLLKRTRERTATDPAFLDFGAVHYYLPSHFGFCLGVQNAIERAYEAIYENPGRQVYMLSELIHNPFVNEDLRARGLKYLQSDKGVPLRDPETGRLHWDLVSKENPVITPAFGATDEDKVRLIEKGIAVNRYDATCMLVEKVWKAARRFGAEGFTVLIHGKSEHEETKATFSNTAKSAPCLVIRNLDEARKLGEIILVDDPSEKRRQFRELAVHHTEDFDPDIDLQRLAVVNQTTLLRNETLEIIKYLESVMASKYGETHVSEHLNVNSKGDTLCYATQVNQDALGRACSQEIDLAVVVGGKNSSNTFQLFRVCEKQFGERAFYIQSEANILSPKTIEHYIFPYDPKDPKQGRQVERSFLPDHTPVKILLTGGASCPDGIIQQVISRINGFFPAEQIRSIDDVLHDLGAEPSST